MLLKDETGNVVEVVVAGTACDDVWIEEAYYTDSDEIVSEQTIEWLMDRYSGDIEEEYYMNRVAEADFYEYED